MSIRLVCGKIGSGKSYYVVNHILDNYCFWDDKFDNFVLKPEYCIYSNIDGLRVAQDLMFEIEKAGGVNPFFTVEYQKEFCRDKRIIYVIDEAQRPDFFHRKFYDKQVFYFFQYHRHLGIDIYLITQDVDSLVKEVRCLPEFYVEAVRRTKSLTGEFRYNFCHDDGEKFKSKILKPKKIIFAMYKSMDAKELEVLPSAPRRFIFVFIVFIILALIGFKFMFLRLFMPSSAEAKKQEVKRYGNAFNSNHDNVPLFGVSGQNERPSNRVGVGSGSVFFEERINVVDKPLKRSANRPVNRPIFRGIPRVQPVQSDQIPVVGNVVYSSMPFNPQLPDNPEPSSDFPLGCSGDECYTVRDGKVVKVNF